MGTNNGWCTNCGSALLADQMFCERCGARRQADPAPGDPPAADATVMAAPPVPVDATVMVPVAPDHTAVLPPVPNVAPPLPPPPGAPMGYAGPPQPLHPLVLIPVLGLLGIIGVLQYLARQDWKLLEHLFSGGILRFSYRVVSLSELALTLSITITILAMIVGLLRGSRIAQALTITFSAGVAVGEFVYLAAKGQAHMWGQANWVAPVLLPICAVIILALLPYPGLRSFFAQRDEGPLGIGMARVAAAYFGWNLTVFAALLILGGGVAGKILYWGVGFLAISALLLVGYQMLVRLGVIGGVIIGAMCLAYIGTLIAFVSVNDGIYDLSVVVGIVVAAITFCALWMPPSSRAYFGPAGMRGTTRPIAATVMAFILFIAVGVGSIVVGSIAKSKGDQALNYYDSSSYDSSSDYSSDYSSSYPTYSPTDTYTYPSQTPTEDYSSSYDSYGSEASYTHRWTTTATADGGYTESITIQTGDPEHYTSGMQNGYVTAGASCTINETTDAVVAAKITMTNTSPNGFDSPMTFHLDFGGSWDNPQADVHYTDDDECKDSGFGAQSTSPASSGSSINTYVYFVLSNYYTPDHPDGDLSVRANATLSLAAASMTDDSGSTITFTPGSLTGLGVTNSYGTSSFPIAP